MVLKKFMPALHRALGVYLPLITTNCAVLGVTMLDIDNWDPSVSFGTSFGNALLYSIGAGLGFMLAIVLFAGIRERMAGSDMPPWMDGFPGALITAGLMSIAFLGFNGLSF